MPTAGAGIVVLRAVVRAFLLAMGLLLAATTTACSIVVDSDRVQCTVDADCAARGPMFAGAVCSQSLCQPDPHWACLSSPPPPSTQEGPFRVSLSTVDLVTRQPVSGATVRLCRRLDIDCGMPIDSFSSDEAGAGSFLVDASFSGYVDVQAQGFVPSLYFFNPPIDHDQEIAPLSLSTPIAYGLLQMQLGGPPDPARGGLVIQSQDCTGSPAAGVSYSIPQGDDRTVVFYAVNMLPTSMVDATDAGGYGGMINVPPGTVTLSARLKDGDVSVGTVSLLVRAGAITYSQVVPLAN